LSDIENNYNIIEREGLSMVYALQEFLHYLLGSPFKFFIDHSTLKYLVNKPVLGRRICHWLLIFQEFEFEVVVKPRKYNVGSNYLSRLEIGEASGSLDDKLPDAQLFRVEAVPDQLAEIIEFITIGHAPPRYTQAHHHQLVICSVDYQLIARQLYKLGTDGILHC
jgi:hypothetical protein